MSLTQKFILFCLLLVTGTSWVVLTICTSESNESMRSQILRHCSEQAGQIVDILGLDLVHDEAESAEARGRVLSTLNRILKRSEDHLAIYAVIYQDGRAVLIQEARRTDEPRKFGTPVALTHAGHRARRTMAVQSEIGEGSATDVVRTYAPIVDKNRRFFGLLVTETRFPTQGLLSSNTWFAIGISLFAGLLALSILVISVARPLERMQDQLVAKENLSPAQVRGASGLLREVTLIVDKAHADRDLFEAQLKQQDRQQESSIRRKDEVVANSVHELRTPLTSIIASLELLTDNDDVMTNEERREFMEQASKASRHMMLIVNDMLDAAVLDAGQMTMEIDNCNLREVLNDAKRSMEIIATARKMTLVVESIDPDLEVLADAPRLLQVILNLLSNAVKYTPGNTTITLRGWPSLNSVIVEVEDQGIAIPVKERDQLFTKFSPLKNESRSDHVDSTGIGLYVTKKLIEMMNGTIGYRSSETGGSVFWFTLPLAPERAELTAPIAKV